MYVCPIYVRISWAYFFSLEALIRQSVRLHEKHVELKMYVSDRKFSTYLNPANCSQRLLIWGGVRSECLQPLHTVTGAQRSRTMTHLSKA